MIIKTLFSPSLPPHPSLSSSLPPRLRSRCSPISSLLPPLSIFTLCSSSEKIISFLLWFSLRFLFFLFSRLFIHDIFLGHFLFFYISDIIYNYFFLNLHTYIRTYYIYIHTHTNFLHISYNSTSLLLTCFFFFRIVLLQINFPLSIITYVQFFSSRLMKTTFLRFGFLGLFFVIVHVSPFPFPLSSSPLLPARRWTRPSRQLSGDCLFVLGSQGAAPPFWH